MLDIFSKGSAGRKNFFFEKQKQETFGPLHEVVKRPGVKINKVFFASFLFTKKKSLTAFAKGVDASFCWHDESPVTQRPGCGLGRLQSE
jgi:hypothetical protein